MCSLPAIIAIKFLIIIEIFCLKKVVQTGVDCWQVFYLKSEVKEWFTTRARGITFNTGNDCLLLTKE